ncbi:MAG TPA: ATP-binding protein [Bacteroidetes bacterium]|nr:ATP-binding protein [Bacteroidota bacterium]
MPRAHTLRIPGQTSELARVRRHVESWAREAGLSERAARQIRTAVDEAVANAIEHGIGDRAAETVTIQARAEAGGLAVVVRHRGDRFDPTAPPVPLADVRKRRAVHGYGLHLLRALVDELGYTHSRGTNEVRLVKRKA